MAPIRKNTINHFTHPAHKLTEIKSNEEYICDGCKLMGNRTRFNCGQCEFDLHEHCAKCPMTLTSLMHPLHPLRLIVYQVSLGPRSCHACHKPVEGLVYQCTTKDCSFIVHPGCANSSSSAANASTTTTTTNIYDNRRQSQGAPATWSTGLAGNIAQRVAVTMATNAAFNGIKNTFFGPDDTGSGQVGGSSSDIPQQCVTDDTWSGQAGGSSSDIPQQCVTDDTSSGQPSGSSSDIPQQCVTDDTWSGQDDGFSSDIPQQRVTDDTRSGQDGGFSSDIPQQCVTDDTWGGQDGGFSRDIPEQCVTDDTWSGEDDGSFSDIKSFFKSLFESFDS